MLSANDSNQATMGTTTVQDPSMLDNVSPQDFHITAPQSAQPVQQPVQHPITTDNPFIQEAATQVTGAQPVFQVPAPSVPTPAVQSSSAPVNPPAPMLSTDDAQSSTTPADNSVLNLDKPIDHDKLADMKREALEHLEPLADHIDGTPEETFRTTMMMIQANDNHTLLEKALKAAKEIADDKVRAQAMLDIINEINYFSQVGTEL